MPRGPYAQYQRHVPHPAPQPSPLAQRAHVQVVSALPAPPPAFPGAPAPHARPGAAPGYSSATYRPQARHAGSVPAAQPRAPEPVVLHIYHLSGKKRIKFANRVLRMFGTGAYHAAVEVYGVEWSFGFKQVGTGVFSCPPTGCSQHTYKKPYLMGYTSLTADQVQATIDRMAMDWTGASYDLLKRNCTHFSNEFCQRLGAAPLPKWVMSLAAAGAKLEDVREVGVEAKLAKGESPKGNVSAFSEGLIAIGKDGRGANITEKTECCDVARGCRRCCAC